MTDSGAGRLGYDVSSPEGELSAERPIYIGLILVVVTSVLAFAVGWLALARVAQQGLVSLVGALSVPAVALSRTYLATRRGWHRRRRNALVAVGAAALFSAVFVNGYVGSIRPTFPQLRHAISDVDLPDGFHLLGETTRGGRTCNPRCPQIERVYRADRVENAVRVFVDALLDQGWHVPDPNIPPATATFAVRDKVYADVFEGDNAGEIRVVLSAAAEFAVSG